MEQNLTRREARENAFLAAFSATFHPDDPQPVLLNQPESHEHPLDEFSLRILRDMEAHSEEIHVTRPNDEKQTRALHGLYRALIHNMVVGVSEGYKKELELVGVGYRAQSQGQVLELSLGYSHAIFLRLPAEIKVEAKSERNKNPLIILESCDKQLIGQVCAKIRSFRKPEPYKGKGIKFVGEVIRRKSGKSAGAK